MWEETNLQVPYIMQPKIILKVEKEEKGNGKV